MSQPSNLETVKAALQKLSRAVQDLSEALDTTDYTLSSSAPEYLTDADDFAYEIMSFVQDELEEIGSKVVASN